MSNLSDSLGRFYAGSVALAYGAWVESCAPCCCYRCSGSLAVERFNVRVVRNGGRTFTLSHVRPESLQDGPPESQESAAGRFLAAVL